MGSVSTRIFNDGTTIDGDAYSKDASLFGAVFGDYFAVVFFHDIFANGQAQPRAFAWFFGGKKWFPDVMDWVGKADAGILKTNQYLVIVHACGDGQVSTFGHGVHGIFDQVAEDLKEVGAADGGDVFVKVADDRYPVGSGLVGHYLDGLVHHGVDTGIIEAAVGIAGEVYEFLDYFGHADQACSSLLEVLIDFFGVALFLGSQGEVHVTKYSVEGIVQFVGNASGEFTYGGHTFGDSQSFFQAGKVGDIFNDQDAASNILVVGATEGDTDQVQ